MKQTKKKKIEEVGEEKGKQGERDVRKEGGQHRDTSPSKESLQ